MSKSEDLLQAIESTNIQEVVSNPKFWINLKRAINDIDKEFYKRYARK